MNRGARAPGGPKYIVGPQKILGIHYDKYRLHCVNCTKFGHLILTKKSVNLLPPDVRF